MPARGGDPGGARREDLDEHAVGRPLARGHLRDDAVAGRGERDEHPPRAGPPHALAAGGEVVDLELGAHRGEVTAGERLRFLEIVAEPLHERVELAPLLGVHVGELDPHAGDHVRAGCRTR